MVLTTPYGARATTMVLTRVPRQLAITSVVTLVFPGRRACRSRWCEFPGRANIPAPHAIAHGAGPRSFAAAACTFWGCPPSLLGYHRWFAIPSSGQVLLSPLHSARFPESTLTAAPTLIADHGNSLQTRRTITRPGAPPTGRSSWASSWMQKLPRHQSEV